MTTKSFRILKWPKTRDSCLQQIYGNKTIDSCLQQKYGNKCPMRFLGFINIKNRHRPGPLHLRVLQLQLLKESRTLVWQHSFYTIKNVIIGKKSNYVIQLFET